MDRRQFLVAAGALALAPRALARASGGTPVGLVTADLEARLVAVDLASGRVLRRIPVHAGPRAIESVGNTAVAAHWNLGLLTLVDGATLRPRHTIPGFEQPRYVAACPDLRHAFVSEAGRGAVAVVDLRRARVVARTPVGPLARHLSVDPTGSQLWVALGPKAAEVAVLDVADPTRPRLLDRLRPPFLAHDVGFAPDGAHVWVSSGDRDELAVYSRDGRLLARVAGDWPPQHVTFFGGRAYVASGWSGTLNVHRVDGAHLARTVVPVGSYNVQWGAGRVLTPGLGTGTLTILDDAGAVRRELRVARSSHDACVVAS